MCIRDSIGIIAASSSSPPYPFRVPAEGGAELDGEFGAGEQARFAEQIAEGTAGGIGRGEEFIEPSDREHTARSQGVPHGPVALHGQTQLRIGHDRWSQQPEILTTDFTDDTDKTRNQTSASVQSV